MPNITNITHAGKTQCLKDWAKETKIPSSTIAARLKANWSIADALNTPVDRRYGRGGRRKKSAPRPCPELKKHPTSGQAYCRWYQDKKEHWKYFGEWGSAEAQRKYKRFALEWAIGGAEARKGNGPDVLVADVVKYWLGYCERTYRKHNKPTSEVHCNKSAMRHLVELYGEEPAEEFGARELRCVREAMVNEQWTRKTINDNCARIVRAFGWAAGEGHVPLSVSQMLALVEPLVAGRRTEIPEGEPVEPVPLDHVSAVLAGEHLHVKPKRRAVLVAMIRVQLSTGMRPGELCELRVRDIDRAAEPWRYQVREVNKTLHLDRDRIVFFGPKARADLAPLLVGRAAEDRVFVFAPWRAKAKETPITVALYRGRIRAACVSAGVPRWTPNQLRHNRATEVMDRYEDDKAAAAALGNSPEVARQVYAHRAGESVAKRIAEETG